MEKTKMTDTGVKNPADLLAASLTVMLDPGTDLQTALHEAVQAAQQLTGCEHVFLTRYDSVAKAFTATVWKSTINPGTVAVDQKFMGESYLAKQTVLIKDLSQYNYRLRSWVARLGLMSMVGIPLQGRSSFWGAMECFSREQDYFSQDSIGHLSLLANQVALLIDQNEQSTECKLWEIESAFLHDLHASDQSSPGTLLYKLGTALGTLFAVDGIAVFGIEPEAEYDILQEVMAEGFTAQDVTVLKKAIHTALLDKLLHRTDFVNGDLFMKHSIGVETKKVITIAPVAWRKTLHGLIVLYNKAVLPEANQARCECFAARMIHYVATMLNRKSLYNTIQRIGLTDTLTQLANRRLFDYILAREFEKVRRSQLSLGLLMIDIDFFKHINDEFGHQAGDSVLEQLGSMLKKSFRSIDLPARYGGEEFAVILPDTDKKSAFAAADRFRQEVEAATFTAGSFHIALTVSIGVATHTDSPGHGYADPASLLYAADQALYQAKQQGRNRTIAVRS